jgi:hypothetical protein
VSSTDRRNTFYEIDGIPAQGDHFSSTEAVPVGHQHHSRVAMGLAITTSSLDQPLDFSLCQVLTGPELGIGPTPWRPFASTVPIKCLA